MLGLISSVSRVGLTVRILCVSLWAMMRKCFPRRIMLSLFWPTVVSRVLLIQMWWTPLLHLKRCGRLVLGRPSVVLLSSPATSLPCLVPRWVPLVVLCLRCVPLLCLIPVCRVQVPVRLTLEVLRGLVGCLLLSSDV